jgi:hypothetical protein
MDLGRLDELPPIQQDTNGVCIGASDEAGEVGRRLAR